LVSGECSKQAPIHRSPTLYGQWKWVELDWTFGPGTGITYPGPDSTVILQLDSSTYSILVNGQIRQTGACLLSTSAFGGNTDSTLDVSDPGNYSFARGWVISGNQQLLIQNDILSLTQYSLNPAGTATVFKFTPYP